MNGIVGFMAGSFLAFAVGVIVYIRCISETLERIAARLEREEKG